MANPLERLRSLENIERDIATALENAGNRNTQRHLDKNNLASYIYVIHNYTVGEFVFL